MHSAVVHCWKVTGGGQIQKALPEPLGAQMLATGHPTPLLLQNYYIQINDIVLSLYLDLDLYSEFHYW